MTSDVARAIMANQTTELRRLLRKDTVNNVDEDGFTPLYFAAMKPTTTVATLSEILTLGASVDALGADKETPLYIATFHGRLDFVELLVKNGAQLNTLNGAKKESVLHLAARLGYTDVTQWLVKAGADINSQNARQQTPLYAAASAGQHNTVYVLLEAGANSALADADGRTPLYVASEKEYKHVVVLLKASRQDLRAAKAEADAEFRNRPTPIMSSDQIMDKANTDKGFVEAVRRRSSLPTPPPITPMEVVEIRVPEPKARTHDPLTGQSKGPCRSLEEVGYDEPPPIPKELQNRPPARLSRIGGTSMSVMTDEGNTKKPVMVEELRGEPEMEFYVPPKRK